VLADVGDDEGLGEAAGGPGLAPYVVDDVRGVEMAVVGRLMMSRTLASPLRAAISESHFVGCWLLVVGCWLKARGEGGFRGRLEVADEGDIGADVFVDLGGSISTWIFLAWGA